MSELVVGGPEIKHIGRGWLRAPGCRQARTWPAIAKRLIDSGPYDRRTSPLLGIKGEKKVESEGELRSKAATRYRSANGLS
eukprot:1503045-Pyramimonas_sp.AAC.1